MHNVGEMLKVNNILKHQLNESLYYLGPKYKITDLNNEMEFSCYL